MIKVIQILIALFVLTSCIKNKNSVNEFSEVENSFYDSCPDAIVKVPISSVPIDLINLLKKQYYWPDGKLPDPLSCLLIDLNGDKLNEYFFDTPMGGSGGEHYLIVSNIGGKWVIVHEFQGRFHLVPNKSDWCAIIGIYRGGCGYYLKSKYIFNNKKYVTKWEKEYNRKP